jgi:hypothetical protein
MGNAAVHMMTKRQDEETGAQYPVTYTTGNGELATIHKPCMRSCVAGQGL